MQNCSPASPIHTHQRMRWRFQQKCFPSIVVVGVKNNLQASVPRCHLLVSEWKNLASCSEICWTFCLLWLLMSFNGYIFRRWYMSCFIFSHVQGMGMVFLFKFCLIAFLVRNAIPSLVCWVTLWWILSLSHCEWKWPMFCIPFHLVLKPCVSETV